jgi:CheY-like chemotaxis protein
MAMNILAVDDRGEDLYLLQKMLEGKGFNVTPAENGKEAFEKLKEFQPDLVISDILMPEMDGYQLLKKIKSTKKYKKIPFIFYTATYTSKKDEDFAYSLGASRFIVKPEEPEAFVKIIDKTLKDHESGILTSIKPQIEQEEEYLREYNHRLVSKLKDKFLELSEAHVKLRESEEFLGALVNSICDPIIYINREGDAELSNKEGKKMQEKVLKKVLPEIDHKGECNFDGDLNFGDGYYDVCCYPVISKSKSRLGSTIVLRDITDRKKIQAELKNRLEELEKWQRLTIGRELKMIELKKRIKELENRKKP